MDGITYIGCNIILMIVGRYLKRVKDQGEAGQQSNRVTESGGVTAQVKRCMFYCHYCGTSVRYGAGCVQDDQPSDNVE